MDILVLVAARELAGAAAGRNHEVLVIKRGARFKDQLATVEIKPRGAVTEQQLNVLFAVPVGRAKGDLIELLGAGEQRL